MEKKSVEVKREGTKRKRVKGGSREEMVGTVMAGKEEK